MTVNEFIIEYESLSIERRKDFFRRIFSEISENLDQDYVEDFVREDLLPVFLDAEGNDFFGTEGFRG